MSLEDPSENPAVPRVNEEKDKHLSDSPDTSPERETWRRAKKQRPASQSRESSGSPAKRRKMGQSDQGSTEFPPSRFMGQQHGAPFIPVPPQPHQTPSGYFYPPYPYPMQQMWFNSQQCGSGPGSWSAPTPRQNMAAPSIVSTQSQRKSSDSNSEPDYVSIFAPVDDSLLDQESQCSKKAGKRPKPPSLLFVTPSSATGEELDTKSPPTSQEAKGHSLPYSKEALVSSLYKTKKGGVRKPKPSQLQESLLYKAFGDSAVIQGVEDESAPMLCFDPSQKMSLQSSLCATEPMKLKAQPKFRVSKYPLHESTQSLLSCAKVDPVFLKRKDLKKQGLDSEKNLVISQIAEGLDNSLLSVQKAMLTGMAAVLALQQGLGSV